MASKLATQKIVTPAGDLVWVFIDGEGKEDLQGNMRYVASLRLKDGSAECDALISKIDTFWTENKPKGRKLKSNGIRDELHPKEDPNDEEEVQKPTGFKLFSFWTGTTYPDGKPRVIRIRNARGGEASLGGKKIGNGTVGAISGTLSIYDQGVAATGVTMYLNAIQIKTLVEYESDDGFEKDDEAEGWTGKPDFEGTDETDETDTSEAPAKKVRM